MTTKLPPSITLTLDEARALIRCHEESSDWQQAADSVNRQLDALKPKRIEHTPGPWGKSAAGSANGLILQVVQESEPQQFVAVCHLNGNGPEAIANRDLIAAAPDTTEACQMLVDWAAKYMCHSEDLKPAIAAAEKALSKARGES